MSAGKDSPEIRVVLADDHPLIAAGFEMTLQSFSIVVVGKAMTPEEAVRQYETLLPDVFVLDIRFGEAVTGFDVAKEILGKFPGAKIVFLSQLDQDNLIKEAYGLGARAFVTKNASPELLATAIRHVHGGETYFIPQVAQRLARLAVDGDTSPRAVLNPRELEVFKCMALGLTNVQMAQKLDLSIKTISLLSQAVKAKLGTDRGAEIARLAIKHGYIQP